MEVLTVEEAVEKIRGGHLNLRGMVIEGELSLKGMAIRRLDLKRAVIESLNLRGTTIKEYLDLDEAIIKEKMDLIDSKINRIYADGAIALAAHLSLQSRIITSPSKLLIA